MRKLELVKATEEDRPFLFALRKLTMTEHLEQAGLFLSDEEHELSLNGFYECAHLVIESGKKVGFIKFRDSSDLIRIYQIQISPEHQGRGIGYNLIKELISKARENNQHMELSVLKANPAKKLYERLGFEIIGEDAHEFHMKLKSV